MTKQQLHIFPTFDVGGAQRRFLQIADGTKDEWRHVVVSLEGKTQALEGIRPNPNIEVAQLALEKSSGLSWKNMNALRHLFKAVGPDLLCTYNWGSIEAAITNRLWARTPHLHFEDGFGPEEANGTIPRRDLFRRLALGGRSHLIVPSHNLAKIARERWKHPIARLHLLANGVDTDRFRPQTEKSTQNTFTVGFVGALRPEKNVQRLVKAISDATTECTLNIVGAGALRDELERYATKLGVKTEFAGNTDRPETVYGEMDLFALTSDTEQMPLTVLEAMASGRAIVATDVGDIASMVCDENKPFIVPLEKAETALPAAIDALAHDRQRRERIGALNRQKVEQAYSLTEMLRQYNALFDRLSS